MLAYGCPERAMGPGSSCRCCCWGRAVVLTYLIGNLQVTELFRPPRHAAHLQHLREAAVCGMLQQTRS